jgi:hypothetical protein
MLFMVRRTKEAFKWIVGILRKHKIAFQITGGFAARVYGSHRKLADIDISVPDSKIKEILQDVKKYAIYGPKRYVDKSFDLQLMTLKYKGQEIDICGTARLYDCDHKRWVKDKTHFNKSMTNRVYGINVPVILKKELIAYKRLLGRKVDLADIKSLTKF